ncbi:MAG TPA: aldolase/citrate lyase family protein [Burkholderiales bacterium]|nr:aldolase/citrate lyase family protein [Burkholderiales bacterium]
MRTNRTKAKIAAGQCAIGVSVAFPSPDLVELCAAVGFDFVSFDCEHEPMNNEQVVHCIRAAESFDITPIVRLPRNPDFVLRFLNAGAQGIHVPRCSSAADLQEVVKWTRFHPLGERTFYNRGRSGNYTVGLPDTAEWAQAMNRELLVICMIEEVKALDKLDEMLAVPGVDVIHVGHMDLWQSMGMPPGMKGVFEQIDEIARRVVPSGKFMSHTIRLTDDAVDRMGHYMGIGSKLFTVSPMDFLRHGGVKLTTAVREMEKKVAAGRSK